MSTFCEKICSPYNLSWSWTEEWNSSNPDIPECFQLTGFPLFLFIYCFVFTIPYLIWLHWQPLSRRPMKPICLAKFIIIAVLIGTNLIEMIGLLVLKRPSLYFIPPSVYGICLILQILVIFMEREKNAKSSGIYFMFWLFYFVLGILRTKWLITRALDGFEYITEFLFSIFFVQYALVITSMILAGFSDRVTMENLSEETLKECPESNCSFLSRISFWWFNPLIILGYKKPLTSDVLWSLNIQDRCRTIVPIFLKHLHQFFTADKRIDIETEAAIAKKSKKTKSVVYKSNNNASDDAGTVTKPLLGGDNKQDDDSTLPQVEIKDKSVSNAVESPTKPTTEEKVPFDGSLLKTFAKSYGKTFLVSMLMKFVVDCLLFVSPNILKLIIQFIDDTTEPIWRGYLYAAAMFLCAVVQTLLQHQYFHIVFVMGMHVRAVLTSAIYRKSLFLSNAAKRASTVGEIVNLMSVDAQKFLELVTYLNMLWSGPFQIAVSLLFLWKELGPSVLAGVGVMLLLIPVNVVCAHFARNFQAKQMKLKDSRIKLMNEILNGIKVLKLYAWEGSFMDQVSAVRQKELDVLRNSSFLNAISAFTWSCSPFLVSLTTFAVYVLSSPNNVLNAEKAFVSISLFNILRFPLMMFPMVISNLVQASVSLKRLTLFFNRTEIDPDVVDHNEMKGIAVKIEKGNFSWDKKAGEPILKDIDFEVEEGKFVSIVGPVGSGKSSLLSTILGDVEKLSGNVNVQGSIAYVPQQAWIRNSTLRDNILFNRPYDKEFYDQVIEACALKPDLDILSDGDLTEIGEKGINLSGGQKQRISLARACYSRADMYLLDDPLSAVDSHVAKHLLDHVLGPCGLLHNKTRIIATHNITVVPHCDKIFVLSSGVITEQGSFTKLLEHAGAFASFMAMHLAGGRDTSSTNVSNEDDDDSEEKQQIIKLLEEAYARDNRGAECPVNMFSRQRSQSNENAPNKEEQNGDVKSQQIEKKPKKLIEEEQAQVGNVKLTVFLSYFKAMGLLFFFLIIFLNILSHVSSLGSHIWLADWSEDIKRSSLENMTQVELNQNRDMRLGVYGALGLAQALLAFVGSLSLTVGSIRAAGNLHTNMLRCIGHCPSIFFDTVPLGRILNRFSSDMTSVDLTIPMVLNGAVLTGVMTLMTVVAVVIPNPWILIPLLIVLVLYIFIQRFYVSSSRQLKRLESTFKSPIYSLFSETLQGVSSIRAYGLVDRFIDLNDEKVDMSMTAYYPNVTANRWLAVRLESIGNLIVLLSALFAVASRGSNLISAGLAGLSISYAMNVTQTLNWMVRMSSELEANIVSVERIKEYSEQPSEAPWFNEENKPSDDWPRGEIKFQNYATRYREGLDFVLKDVSCHIKNSEKVGIVGRTGSGKSSLVLALFRMIEPVEGSIFIDGKDISQLGLHDLRGRLTIIPQDPVLFAGTLRLNLDPFNKHTDDELWNILEHAYLKTYVQEHGKAKGLDMQISEGGENLSVGQRQLVCLARALLRRSKILVLDEATAAIDLDTDQLIQNTIRKEFKESTVITIAHRLNTVLDYDKILVLDAGSIKEYDSPTNLLNNESSVFYQMAKSANLIAPQQG